MADNRNRVLQLLITARDQASSVLSSLKTQLAALAVAIGSAFSIKESARFEKALDAIRARADETGPALDALIERAKTAAQTIGPEFGFSATEAAGGIKELIAAGFSGSESIDALRGTLALAAMEEIRVADAAKLISDAIAQFGLTAADASSVADILAQSAGAVAATAVEMAEALKYTGNAASQAGLSLTETSAILDVLAKAGQRGSEAGTGLSSVLSILANPTHAATKALFDLGATSTELSAVLDFLEERGINAADAIALFGEQGGRVINTLLAQGGSAEIRRFGEEITQSGKSAEATAKIMQQNLLGAFDRFWESLKRVGVELATPKLEPFAKGLDTLTQAMNTFASNAKIQAFQQAIADGFSAIYTAARNFAQQIDWAGVSAAISGAFEKIKGAAESALTSLQSLYASLTGSLPGASTIAQHASDGLKAAWAALGGVAEGAAKGLDRIASALSGPVAVGSDLAQRAIRALTGETDSARETYDALNDALKKGKVSQEQVAAAWERLQRVIHEAQAEIDAAQIAYDAVVAAQKAGNATQQQVTTAWERLQAVIGAAKSKIDSAELAYDGLNDQFLTGKGLSEAVAAAHTRLTGIIESARQSIERITQSIDGQTQGFQALWAALKNNAPTFLKETWDSLTTAAAALLSGINSLVQKGSEFLAGFVEGVDLTPVREMFNQVADAIGRVLKTIAEQFPQAKTAGQDLANVFTVAWSGVVGILALVVAGTVKVVEAIGRATLEVGKYFDKYSDEEIAKIEANLDGMAQEAADFADVAERSFDASGKALDRMRENAKSATEQQHNLKIAGEGSAGSQIALAEAAAKQAAAQGNAEEKTRLLATAIQLQKAEVDRLAASDLSSESAKNQHAAATQKLWEMQDAFGLTVQGLTEDQFANVKSSEAVRAAQEALNARIGEGVPVLEKYIGGFAHAPATLEDLRATMEETRKKLVEVEEAQKNGNLTATATKSITEQVAEARKAANDALAVYNNAIENNILKEETAVKTAERKRQAQEALSRSGQAVIDASIQLAEVQGKENEIATLTAQKKEELVVSSTKIAEEYKKEADASQRVADALQLKYEALVTGDPTNIKAIQQAKEAADSAHAEAFAKKATAIEIAAKIPLMEKEAQQAKIMAGPIGQLTRLYQEQAKEHERAADASERYHDLQVTEAEGALRLAELSGDETAKLKAGNAVRDARIAQAESMAATRAQEVADTEKAISAKVMEMAADSEWTQADQDAEDQLRATLAAKQDAAAASQQHADQLRAEAKASEEAAAAAKKEAEAAQAVAEAADQRAAAGKAVTAQWGAANEVLAATGGNVEKLNAAFIKLQEEYARGRSGFMAFATATATAADEVAEAYRGQEAAVSAAVDALEHYAETGEWTGEVQRALALNSSALESRFNLLDEQDFDRLRGALDSANDKLREMQNETQSAKDRLAELNAELLEAQGQDQKAKLLREQLDYQQQLAEIEAQRAEAEALGNRELLAILNDQQATLEKIHATKMNNLAAESDAEGEVIDKTTRRYRELGSAIESADRGIKSLSSSNLDSLLGQTDKLYQTLDATRKLL